MLGDLARSRLKLLAYVARRGASKLVGALGASLGTRNHRGADGVVFPGNVFDTVAHFSAPGKAFEADPDSVVPPRKLRARAVAFYLPQFHAIPENDRWWGRGFTEWHNLARAMPRFEGHYQPRIPRDLGFYDLGVDAVLERQCELATRAGIEAFCFYYYWFNGHRLLEKPLDRFCELESLSMPFCILWANENWTRRWDGRDSDVLMSQDYRTEDDAAFIEDTVRYFGHPRYLRVDDRPVFLLYRASLLPEPRAIIERWREAWRERLGSVPWVIMVQSFGDRDPRHYGCDAAVEFPPHKVTKDIGRSNHEHRSFDPNFRGQVRRYRDMVAKSLADCEPADYTLLKTACPHWDHEPRSPGRGVTVQGSTPLRYARWLAALCRHASRQPLAGEPLVFINAWNEWAEGTYLEPDCHYGHAYLNITRRVLARETLAGPAKPPALLLIGHDAHANGAQMILLSLLEWYRREMPFEITVMLGGVGRLLPEYQALADTLVLDEQPPGFLDDWLQHHPIDAVITNTVVCAPHAVVCARWGLPVVSLIHELPTLIRERRLEQECRALLAEVDTLVFPSGIVRDGFLGCAASAGAGGSGPGAAMHASSGDDKVANAAALAVRPQGLYKTLTAEPESIDACYRDLGLDPAAHDIVLNVGYADHRKGFDRFVDVARHGEASGDRRRQYVWVGKVDIDMSNYLKRVTGGDTLQNLHIVDFTDSIAPWYAAASVLFLSSREDPYPTVVLEAMSFGLPVVMFEGATGFDKALLAHASCIAGDDAASIEATIARVIDENTEAEQAMRRDYVGSSHDFSAYARYLLTLLPIATDAP